MDLTGRIPYIPGRLLKGIHGVRQIRQSRLHDPGQVGTVVNRLAQLFHGTAHGAANTRKAFQGRGDALRAVLYGVPIQTGGGDAGKDALSDLCEGLRPGTEAVGQQA